MAFFILIETATPTCSIAVTENEKVIEIKESNEKNSHSRLVTLYIDHLLKNNQIPISKIDAIAVSMGPGSYTGLRIGVSTAKGLCYALSKPLIAVNTLQSMAYGMIAHYTESTENLLFCPMIDARRMEVYSAIYDSNGDERRKTKAEIIDENSFMDYLESSVMVFSGDGALKCQEVIRHSNARFFDDFKPSASHMAKAVYEKYTAQQFEDVAYFEPFYLKDFIAGIPKVKGLR
ncbi:MAG: tRNA (adenosine(37)-N6)-threonylcarbamoyltransferase complex dimerization subunit type 1 TsaB [Bacteroidales bacterium]|nr:tRNA (adenosine(37)-N6)-threonylcarbamoyltransferase complex dimerization subunit type 1 TsaB [Bacteroidales bacterium]MCF8402304.1 tRNA (adenosine(37)-N6)-threonylcarbamoyltransferase complex dimerization subunit type 1 TsaB [Bacteroidales bacterium]